MFATKKIGIVAAGVLAVLIVALVLVYSNLSTIARGIVERQIPNLTFASLNVGWNSVTLTGVQYTDPSGKVLLKSDAISVSPSLASFFSDTFKVSSVNIAKPYVYIERRANGEVVLPVPQPAAEAAPAPAAQQEAAAAESFKLYIGKVEIEDGSGEFVDKSVGHPYAEYKISDVDIELSNISVPTVSDKIPFEISMTIEGARAGRFEQSGWFDPVANSGEIDLEVSNLFIPLAEPYYRSSNTTAKLSDGRLDLDLEMKIKNKEVVMPGEVKMSDLKFAGTSGKFFGLPADAVADALESRKLPTIPFEVSGNMDHPDQIRVAVLRKIAEKLAKELGLKEVEKRLEQELLKGDESGEKKQQLDTLKGLFKKK